MSFSERQSRTRFVPDAALPQQKERDAALADRPCPTVHVSILSHPNVLWCPDFISWGLFLRLAGGVFSGGPMFPCCPAGQLAPCLWLCAAWLSCGRSLFSSASMRPCCPMAQAQARHAQGRPRGPAGAAVFPASLPGPREGVSFLGSHAGRSLRLFLLASALALPHRERVPGPKERNCRTALIMAVPDPGK